LDSREWWAIDDLTSRQVIRRLARRYGIAFRRRWGQNFLADASALDQLVDSLELSEKDRVLEVGPGLGTLTRRLVERAAQVVAVEIDRQAVKALERVLQGVSNVRLVEGDILKQEIGSMLVPPYRVVGNIPYNITGALLPHLLQAKPAPAQLDLLVQKEVAKRIAAPPGDWSLATLAVRIYGTAQLRLTIGREAFEPAPAVDSALLRIQPAAQPAIPTQDLPAFFAFVTPFFMARRKQLPYAVGRALGVSREEAQGLLRSARIDPQRRAQTLTLQEWRALFEAGRDFMKPDMIRAAP
jgi:16S rRNA (adenine1518-N6/adenine1519-N6)-dimethyltransferase